MYDETKNINSSAVKRCFWLWMFHFGTVCTVTCSCVNKPDTLVWAAAVRVTPYPAQKGTTE